MRNLNIVNKIGLVFENSDYEKSGYWKSEYCDFIVLLLLLLLFFRNQIKRNPNNLNKNYFSLVFEKL